MPMPPAEVVNSIQTSFDNAAACFRQSAPQVRPRETSRAEAFREKPWLTGLPYPCLAQRFLYCKAIAGAPDDQRKRSIAMAHLTFASRITNVAGTHLPYGRA